MDDLYEIPSRGKFGTIARKLNDNFYLVRVAIGGIEYSTRKNKGMFSTIAALNAAIPSPTVGDWALVGDAFPADLYVCTTEGTWSDSGEDYEGDNVSFNDYVLKSNYDLFKDATNGELVALHEENDMQPDIDYGEYDFDIRDDNGYIIVAFENGHIKTKNFDSSNIDFKSVSIGDNVYDFSIDDEQGNSIIGIKDGQIKTKNFDTNKLKFQLQEGDYDFSIEDANGNVIAKFAKGHIRTKFFDSSDFGKSNMVYCIGDSTTQGQSGIDNPRDDNPSGASDNCYPNRLQDMLGDSYQVVNLGVGGQNTSEILARCGFLDLIVQAPFTLYGNGNLSIVCAATQQATNGVLVDSCSEEPANYFMQQGTDDAVAQMTLCYINGIACNLSYNSIDGNLYIRRVETDSYDMLVTTGEHITMCGNKGEGIYLFRMGTNDVLRATRSSDVDVDNYIAKLKQATSLVPSGKFVVMGMFHGYEFTANEQTKWNEMDGRLAKEFGTRYINGKGFITSLAAFAYLDITPTTDNDISQTRVTAGVKSDEYCIAHGMTPSSFWRSSCTSASSSVDKIHLNKDGYTLMAKMFYDKMKQLNFI